MRSQYKSITFVNKRDSQYQEYCRNMSYLRNSNRFQNESDSKQVITAWLENVVIKFLSKCYPLDERNILTWEELSSMNIYSRKFKEIDGLFNSGNGQIYVEVKASLSKSSYKRGRAQINENLKLMKMISPNITAVLIMADCRYFDPSFGYAKEFIDEKNSNTDVYTLCEGLEGSIDFSSSNKWIWLLNEQDVKNLTDEFGPPHHEEESTEY